MEEDWDDYVASSYAFDESLLEHPSLRVKVFTEPTEEWALFILANRKGLETQLYIPKALELVYNSQLYDKIMDLETGLYYQSARYNYELLRHEVRYGKIV